MKTVIAYSKDLHKSKFDALVEQAKLLGNIRTDIWNDYGSISGVTTDFRKVRSLYVNSNKQFPVPANAWKQTVEDAFNNIEMQREAAKVKVRKHINKIKDEKERIRLYTLLKYNKYLEDNYLSRLMRKYLIRGHNHTHNQILVRSDSYTTFELNGIVYIKIPSLVPYKRICIPINTTFVPKGNLRIILKDNYLEIHYAVKEEPIVNHGYNILGIDKGYTEVFTDSEGNKYGKDLGTTLSDKTEKDKKRYQARNKLGAIANSSNEKKKNNILKNNLGNKKINKQKKIHKAIIKTIVNTSINELVDTAKTIVVEDLSKQIKGKNYGNNQNNKLNKWVKGVIQEGLEEISKRRGSTLCLVNAAYTSQVDHKTGTFGKRVGDLFYCESGEVYDADHNAALNVLSRMYDKEIKLYMPYLEVKAILTKRINANKLSTA